MIDNMLGTFCTALRYKFNPKKSLDLFGFKSGEKSQSEVNVLPFVNTGNVSIFGYKYHDDHSIRFLEW